MPIPRPTRAQLIDQSASDLQSRLQGVDPWLRRTLVGVISIVLGGAFDGLYGYVDWAIKQRFVKTMEAEFLDAYASIWSLTRKLPTASQPTVGFVGTNGLTVAAGTVLVRSDGAVYTLNADAPIAGGAGAGTVTAQAPGSAGDCTVNQQLQFQTPVAGINNIATVTGVGLEGNDTETDDELRARVLTRQAEPPQGGNSNDFQEWGTEVAGVTRTWCLKQWLGPGTIGLTFVMDGRANIIPLAADVAAVQAYVDGLRPVRGTLTVFAPNVLDIPVTAHLTPNTAATQAAAAAALADLFNRELTAGGTTMQVSDIEDALRNAAGVTDVEVTAPAANVAVAAGTVAQLGAVTWS